MNDRVSRLRSLRVFPLLLALLLTLPAVGVTEDAQGKNVGVPAPQPAAGPQVLPTISIDEVKPGQRGYGLSVFAGYEPERFEVEVVGVMRNSSPGVSHILARLTGKGLERSGVANGMSGSPVFIDGRLAGAVAFSWPFSHEAIAGITPIDTMRRLSELKPATMPIIPPPPPPPVPLADLRAGRIPKDLLEKEFAKLQPKLAGGALPSVQWVATGFSEGSMELLRRSLGSAGPAGAVAPGSASVPLTLGGSVAAVLVDGDFRMAAVGTVTDLFSDHVLAFGHPFLGIGPIRVPMATAEVVTVLSNSYSSFKISNLGEEIGAFEQDRQAGIQGRLGQKAPMIPLVMRISGVGAEEPREFRMRMADLPVFMPLLVSSAAISALESASYSTGAQGMDVTARFHIRNYGELEVRQSFDGDNAGAESVSYLMALAAYIVQNPLERVSFDSMEVEMTQSVLPRTATLVGAHADHTVVRPGERVRLDLELVAYRGERFRHSLTLELPEDLPAGRYSLVVGDGATLDGARMTLEPAEPVSFAQALDVLRSFHSRRELVVLGFYGGPGLSVAGEPMPRLPGSVRSLWSAAASASAVPLRSTIAQEHREPMAMPVEGMLRVDLEVRRREPFAGDGGTAGPGTEGGSDVVQNRKASQESGR